MRKIEIDIATAVLVRMTGKKNLQWRLTDELTCNYIYMYVILPSNSFTFKYKNWQYKIYQSLFLPC